MDRLDVEFLNGYIKSTLRMARHPELKLSKLAHMAIETYREKLGEK